MYELLKEISNCIKSLKKKPEVLNTWGDSIFFVYENPRDLVLFAFSLKNIITKTDWASRNLPPEINIRIALHAGPVFLGEDPISGKLNAYGSHVNRAARIEPVTIQGCIYASEQFAALLAIEAPNEFVIDHVGIIELPKKFGEQEIYQIRERFPI